VLASLRSAISSGLALVLPVQCAGCGAPDLALCLACRAQFEQPVQRHDVGGLSVWSAAVYDGVVAQAIVAFKDQGATAQASVLGAALRRALAEAIALLPEEQSPLLLVPVPSSPGVTRRRGYVPLEVLARAAKLPLARSLRQTRAVRDQAALSAQERAENVAGSMAADRALAGRDVLLVDDVVTTGSTLREAARALGAAGATVLGAATIARTPSVRSAPAPPSRPPPQSGAQPG
jgi:predicted amidophosphoribosyltransferase